MTVRLSVTYAATDGSMPENVEIEWTDETPDTDLMHALTGLLVGAPGKRRDAIFRQVAEPNRRPASGYCAGETIYSGDRVQMRGDMIYRLTPNTVGECHGVLVGASVAPLVPLEYEVAVRPEDRVWRAIDQPESDNCQRVTCGHSHEAHDSLDDQGSVTLGDRHGGACDRCGNYDRCRSFVGKKAGS